MSEAKKRIPKNVMSMLTLGKIFLCVKQLLKYSISKYDFLEIKYFHMCLNQQFMRPHRSTVRSQMKTAFQDENLENV